MDYIAYFIAYFIGSIPFGLVLTKAAGYGDIRTIGSGNIGATNVLRTGSKALAALTLILDSSKGAISIALITGIPHLYDYLVQDVQELYSKALLIGLCAILGHCFPIWLNFKGGKGVSTTIGALLAAVPFTGLAAIAIWLFMAFAFRISSLAALTAAALSPLVTLYFYGSIPALINIVMAALVIWRHKDNIKRLLKDEEPRIGKKK